MYHISKNIPNSSKEILPSGGYLPCGGGGNRWSKNFPENFPVRNFFPGLITNCCQSILQKKKLLAK